MSDNPVIYATAPPPLTAMITHTHPDDEAARGAAREIVSWFIQAAPIAFNYLLLDFYHIPRQKQQLMSEANFISDLIDLERQGAQKPDRLLYLLSDSAGGLPPFEIETAPTPLDDRLGAWAFVRWLYQDEWSEISDHVLRLCGAEDSQQRGEIFDRVCGDWPTTV